MWYWVAYVGWGDGVMGMGMGERLDRLEKFIVEGGIDDSSLLIGCDDKYCPICTEDGGGDESIEIQATNQSFDDEGLPLKVRV